MLISSAASSGFIVNPMPSSFEPSNEIPALTFSFQGLPLTREAGSREGVIPVVVTPSTILGACKLTGLRLVQTAEYSRAALLEGHGRLFTARVIVTPSAT